MPLSGPRLDAAHSAVPTLPLGILLFILCFSGVVSGAVQNATLSPDLSGARIVQDHTWPELQVDGKPFFVYGAAFDYFGVPQDLWAHSLDRYHELGINTIDLTIPWNWHETTEGEFDFDGHSNTRRDLRACDTSAREMSGCLALILPRRLPAWINSASGLAKPSSARLTSAS